MADHVARALTMPPNGQPAFGVPTIDLTENPAPGTPAHASAGSFPPPRPARRDPFAVASAVCSLAGFIPIIAQLIGLLLGVIGLYRIRKWRRSGVPLRGSGYAATGIVFNALTLIGWIGAFGALAVVGDSLMESSGALSRLTSPQ